VVSALGIRGGRCQAKDTRSRRPPPDVRARPAAAYGRWPLAHSEPRGSLANDDTAELRRGLYPFIFVFSAPSPQLCCNSPPPSTRQHPVPFFGQHQTLWFLGSQDSRLPRSEQSRPLLLGLARRENVASVTPPGHTRLPGTTRRLTLSTANLRNQPPSDASLPCTTPSPSFHALPLKPSPPSPLICTLHPFRARPLFVLQCLVARCLSLPRFVIAPCRRQSPNY
jgi:hypothetical protein